VHKRSDFADNIGTEIKKYHKCTHTCVYTHTHTHTHGGCKGAFGPPPATTPPVGKVDLALQLTAYHPLWLNSSQCIPYRRERCENIFSIKCLYRCKNPLKDIHLTSFTVFLQKFMAIGSFSKVQPKILSTDISTLLQVLFNVKKTHRQLTEL